MKHNNLKFKRTSGFTLIELMLAMLIGLVIMGGVMKLYMTTRDTQRSSEDQLQLISDARFAMEAISFDLRHAGLWGAHNFTELVRCGRLVAGVTIDCPAGDELPTPITDDCEATGDWYIDIARPIFGENDVSAFSGTCAKEGYKLGTDVLGLHYADTIAIGNLQLAAGVVYVRASVQAGQLFEGPTIPDMNWSGNEKAQNFPLRTRVYYVSDYTDVVGDGVPSLHRVELMAGPVMLDRVLIPGVEDIQFEYGIDTLDSTVNPVSIGKDSQVNSYVRADGLTDDDWQSGRVITVKIWLLMRAEREDRDSVGGNQTFTIAGKPAVTYTDGIRRFLMTSVVRLRNTAKMDKLTVGGS